MILVSWWFHCWVSPYAYRFQNTLESVLMLANVVLILFAVANDVVYDGGLRAPTDSDVNTINAFEVAMLGVLATSTIFAAGMIMVHAKQAKDSRAHQVNPSDAQLELWSWLICLIPGSH